MSLTNDFSIRPNWVFRFRPAGVLSVKELLYNEVYFATLVELSDPLDTKVELWIMKGQAYIHEYFIGRAISALGSLCSGAAHQTTAFAHELARLLAGIDREVSSIVDDWDEAAVEKLLHEHDVQVLKSAQFLSAWRQVLLNLYPTRLATLSFSTKWDYPMMWSSYAEGHRGYCLCFEPRDNKLRLRKHFSDTFVDYALQPIEYDEDVAVNVSLMFDEARKTADAERMSSEFFPTLLRKCLLTKNRSFERESEVRICEGPLRVAIGTTVDESGNIEIEEEYSIPVRRLYHYDVAQLKGIIFGFAMGESQKAEIEDILSRNTGTFLTYECFTSGNALRYRARKALTRKTT